MYTKTVTPPTVFVRDAYLAFHDVVLFDHLNLTLLAGKWTCLLGPSGVGKSSLLRLIAQLVAPAISAHDKTVMHADIESDNAEPLSEQIAYMAQTDLLLPWLSVLDNVLLGTRLRKYSKNERAVLTDKAHALLASVGLTDAAQLYPRHLSGGMRQRAALVRTLMEDKPIILMDEPFSSLDTITRFKLQTLAATLLQNRTVLFITHDPSEALRLADEIYILSGKPATLRSPVALTTPTPRDPLQPELIALQSALLQELALA